MIERLKRRLLRSGLVPNAIKGIMPTFDGWAAQTEAAHEKTVITEPERFEKGVPEIVLTTTDSPFDDAGPTDTGDHYVEGEQFVARFDEALLYGENCEVVTPDRWLIGELLLNDVVLKPKFIEADRVLLPANPERVGGRCATVYSAFIQGNYSHFVLDALPRLMLLEEAGLADGARLMVPGGIPRYQDELLTLMGWPAERRLVVEGGARQFERLLVPSFTHRVYWAPNPRLMRALRERLRGWVPPAEDGPRRVFISREGSAFRRLANRDKIVQTLEMLDFVTIQAEDYSVREQIALFGGAEMIVAPHGAGLTNMIAMAAGGSVVEMVGSAHRLPTYVNLAAGLGLRMAYVGADVEQTYKNDDFSVSVGRLVAALEALGVRL